MFDTFGFKVVNRVVSVADTSLSHSIIVFDSFDEKSVSLLGSM